MRRLFDEHARRLNSEHHGIRCSMSEFLALYSLIRHFVEVRLPRLTEEEGVPRTTDASARLAALVHNFMLACKAVDLMLAAKRRHTSVRDAGRQLLATMHQLMQCHIEAHGTRHVKPKTHWCFDIAECMMQDDFVVDAFVLERLHHRAKAVASNVKNLPHFESSLMAGIVNVHVNSLAERAHSARLVGSTAQWTPDICIADKAQYYGMHVTVDDLVFRGGS